MTELEKLKMQHSDVTFNLERARAILKQAEQEYIEVTNKLAQAMPKNGVEQETKK